MLLLSSPALLAGRLAIRAVLSLDARVETLDHRVVVTIGLDPSRLLPFRQSQSAQRELLGSSAGQLSSARLGSATPSRA